MPANHEVKEDRSSNTNPDEHIVSIDANVFPVPVNPAPDLSVESANNAPIVWKGKTYSGLAKNKPAVRVSNQKQRNGNSKGATVADETVHPPPSAERVGLGTEEEDKKDVEGHGQRPPRVRLHEPEYVSESERDKISEMATHMWNIKLCAWQRGEETPSSKPSIAMMLAQQAPMLATLANTIKVFCTLRTLGTSA